MDSGRFSLQSELMSESEKGLSFELLFGLSLLDDGAEFEPRFNPPVAFVVWRFEKGGENASAPDNMPLFFTKTTSSDLVK